MKTCGETAGDQLCGAHVRLLGSSPSAPPVCAHPPHPGCWERSLLKPSLPTASPARPHVTQQTQRRALSWRPPAKENKAWQLQPRSAGARGGGDAQQDPSYGHCPPAAGCSPPQGRPTPRSVRDEQMAADAQPCPALPSLPCGAGWDEAVRCTHRALQPARS